ncbi:hypothetical protein PATA110616_04810 [Paenibacillus tarimensis]
MCPSVTSRFVQIFSHIRTGRHSGSPSFKCWLVPISKEQGFLPARIMIQICLWVSCLFFEENGRIDWRAVLADFEMHMNPKILLQLILARFGD